MLVRVRSFVLVCATVVGVALFGISPAPAGSFRVQAGYDLFTTDPAGTSFAPISGVPLLANCQGVPIGTFDFGPLGTHPTGTTDTIVRRLDPATQSDPVVTVELVALQLRCEMSLASNQLPTPVGVTLQSDRGRNALDPANGPASGGQLAIQFAPDGNGGVATSNLSVRYDVRAGGINGPIINLGGALVGDTVNLSATAPWSHVLPPGVVACLKELSELAAHGVIDDGFIIAYVNYLLNGGDQSEDFHYGQHSISKFCR